MKFNDSFLLVNREIKTVFYLQQGYELVYITIKIKFLQKNIKHVAIREDRRKNLFSDKLDINVCIKCEQQIKREKWQ